MSGIPRFGHLNTGDAHDMSGTTNSVPSLGMGELDSELGVVLRDWSAQDFSNIYVRFRPHLISHARKFLREESQAEEVVQDAFLYLMTALPELDSELGVLRFLKWKTKMLCLDVRRHSQSGLNSSLVPLADDVVDEAQPSDAIERADDAAIIRQALAKLSPRHREALIATTYEEKSYEEVAQQMGLEGNAFRQLLLRARASFRRALVGEAEVEGKSVSEILSIASRKHARSAVAAIGGASALALVIGLLAASYPQPMSIEEIAFTPAATESSLQLDSESGSTFPRDDAAGSDSLEGSSPAAETQVEESVMYPAEPNSFNEVVLAEVETENTRVVNDQEIDSELASLRTSFSESLDLRVAEALALSSSSGDKKLRLDHKTLVIEAGPELSAYVGIDNSTASIIQHVSLIFQSEWGELTAVPTNFVASSSAHGNAGLEITYVATDFLFGDLGGAFGNLAVDDAPMRNSAIKIDLILDSHGYPTFAEFTVVARSQS